MKALTLARLSHAPPYRLVDVLIMADDMGHGDLGVHGVPSVLVGDEVFWGDDRLEEAAATAADRRRGDHALS